MTDPTPKQRSARGRLPFGISPAPRRAGAGPAAALALALLAGCGQTPRAPEWALNARGAVERAVESDLSGNSRGAALDYALARSETARTGSPALLARAELARCAVAVASLDFAPCERFEALRADAGPAEVAYAEHLQRRPLSDEQVKLLPPAQQALRAPGGDPEADAKRLLAEPDAQARLVAAALWFKDGRAAPPVVAAAVETASSQGWRRPLLAWLGVLKSLADQAGDATTAQRVQRRIDLVLAGGQLAEPPAAR